jgi:hypothetical protein
MSNTPRTEAAWKPDGGDGYPTVDIDFACGLERELNAANDRVKRLEEAGDDLESWLGRETPVTVRINWRQVKEAKL